MGFHCRLLRDILYRAGVDGKWEYLIEFNNEIMGLH